LGRKGHLLKACSLSTGIIPPEIGELKNLQHMNLEWNKLSGEWYQRGNIPERRH